MPLELCARDAPLPADFRGRYLAITSEAIGGPLTDSEQSGKLGKSQELWLLLGGIHESILAQNKSLAVVSANRQVKLSSGGGFVVDDLEVRAHRHGLPDEITDDGPPGEAPATAVIEHRGFKLFFRFKRGDLAGEGELQEIWIRAGAEPLEPHVLRRLAPQAELYLTHARAAMRSGGEPLDKRDPQRHMDRQRDDLQRSAEALRGIGGPGRGLPPQFYEIVGREYDALVTEGEPHPVKTLAANHHVTISAASRWIKEARRRGYIKEDPK